MSRLLVLYMGSLVLRSICIAVIAGICSWRMRNVAMRHAVWTTVLGAMLLMPVIDGLLPATWVPKPVQDIAVEQTMVFRGTAVRVPGMPVTQQPSTSGASAPPVHARTVDWWKAAGSFYVLVSFAMLTRLILAYRRILKLKHTGREISSVGWAEGLSYRCLRWRTPLVLESASVRVPMTIGFLKPVVLLPSEWQSWDEGKLMAVLSHEFAHVRRGDWAIAGAAAIAKCAYWMNPLSWFLERQLSKLAEQASDDAAIGSTRNSVRYAEILLEFAAVAGNERRYLKRGIAMAQHKMRARIERVLSNDQSGTGILKLAGWMLVLILALPVLYSAAALQVSSPRAQAPPSPVKPLAASRQSRPLPPEALPGVAGPQSAQPQLQARQQPRSAPADAPNPVVQSENASEGPYLIRPGDVLSVFVWKQPDLQVTVKVQPDGQIAIPLVQDISAAGFTPPRLKREIENRLKEYFPSPEVTVMLVSTSSYRVSVIGKVRKEGSLTSETPITILEALALAGGFDEFARKDEIRIIRGLVPANGTQATGNFSFNYSDVVGGKLPNVFLKSGDVIVVP